MILLLCRFALPLLPKELAFIRRARFGGEVFTTALWFEGDRLRFLDWRDPAQREAFYQLLDGWGVCWDEQYEQLLAERRRTERDGALKDLPTFDIVVGRDLFVAIEDLEERVLYDYQRIEERHKEHWMPHPIAYFRLAPLYDRIQQKRSALLPSDELSRRGLLDGSRELTTEIERRSLTFYEHLLEYDALLDEIAVTHPTLSYLELTSGVWLERIARIFDSKQAKEGKYDRRYIARIYKDLGMFLSEKGQDVQLYQGIWHDDTNAFLVGSRTGMNVQGQEHAHLIRRFQVMQGEAHFDEVQFLSTMGVLFVRSQQYTVSPYYFHLIDLYVENVLRYTPSETEDFDGSSASLVLPPNAGDFYPGMSH